MSYDSLNTMASRHIFCTLNLGGILREFWEIQGKFRILDGRPLGSIGLKHNTSNKAKNLSILNDHFSITITYRYSKLCLLIPNIHSEGTLSEIFNLGLAFYLMSKKRETFSKSFKASFLKAHKI